MVNIKEVEEYLGKDLYNFSDTAKCLSWAFNSGENIILYGKPGYGKSVGAELFCNYLFENNFISQKPYIMNFSQFTSEELLLGGLDIKKFQEEGTIWYNLLNSFVNYEVFIAEELFDARILTVLKDILTSGQVRLGTQVFPIKTKMIIACTNKSREEVVIDNSTAALFERFYYEHEVCWESWNYSDYLESLKTSTKEEENIEMIFTSFICELASRKSDEKISPRICYKTYKSVKVNGFACILGVKDLKMYLKEGIRYIEQIQIDRENYLSIKKEINSILELQTLLCKKKDINIEDINYYLDSVDIKKKIKIRDINFEIGNEFLELVKITKNDLIEKGKELIYGHKNTWNEEEQFFYEEYINKNSQCLDMTEDVFCSNIINPNNIYTDEDGNRNIVRYGNEYYCYYT